MDYSVSVGAVPYESGTALAAEVTFRGPVAGAQAARLVAALSAGKQSITRLAEYEAARLQSIIIVTHSFEGRVPSVPQPAPAPAPALIYAAVEVGLVPKYGGLSAAGKNAVWTALKKAAGPTGTVQLLPSMANGGKAWTGSLMFRGAGCQARSGQLALRLLEPLPSSIENWPPEWETTSPVFVYNRIDPSMVPAGQSMTTSQAAFQFLLPDYAFQTFSPRLQKTLLDAVARNIKGGLEVGISSCVVSMPRHSS